MEQWEFDELTEATVNRFLPRIPERYVQGFHSMLYAGELSMAVDDLVHTLSANNVPVTRSEQEDLRRLMDHLGQPTDMLANLTLTAQP